MGIKHEAKQIQLPSQSHICICSSVGRPRAELGLRNRDVPEYLQAWLPDGYSQIF